MLNQNIAHSKTGFYHHFILNFTPIIVALSNLKIMATCHCRRGAVIIPRETLSVSDMLPLHALNALNTDFD